jgi:osmoprotectant transport system substrate-binding protein
LILIAVNTGSACIGKIIVIGTSDTPANRVAAEIIMQLITERTGTKVKIIFHREESEVRDGLNAEDEESKIDILLVNNLRSQWGVKFVNTGKNVEEPPVYSLQAGEINYDFWILPGSSWISHGFDYYPLLRKELLIDFPILPRLLNKISSRLSIADFSNLVEKVKAGKKARNEAKDILKQKGLI